jgi:hypothetical protein
MNYLCLHSLHEFINIADNEDVYLLRYNAL